MNIYIESITYFIVVSLPLLLSVIQKIYNKAIDKEETHLYEDVILILVQYLLMISKTKYILLLMTILLLFSIIKKRKISTFLLLMFQLYYCVENYNFNILLMIIESIILIIISVLYKFKKIKTQILVILFIIIKTIFFYILINNTIIFTPFEILTIVTLFIMCTLIFYFAYEKTCETSKLFKSVQDIEENEQIRTSIFKISHEIKNPLAVCKGYLDMYDSNNSEHTEKYVPIVKNEIGKALMILQDFLSLTKTNLKKEIMDINYLIEDCLDNVNLLLKHKEVKVVKELLDDEIYINADYNRLHQVLVNVIKNSIEALENRDNKTIIVKSQVIGKKIVVIVEDNGPGLDKETMKKIKEPFYTTKKSGTGLGVPLSIEIVNAHNGEMKFETIPNRKTVVTILLPLEKRINNF